MKCLRDGAWPGWYAISARCERFGICPCADHVWQRRRCGSASLAKRGELEIDVECPGIAWSSSLPSSARPPAWLATTHKEAPVTRSSRTRQTQLDKPDREKLRKTRFQPHPPKTRIRDLRNPIPGAVLQGQSGKRPQASKQNFFRERVTKRESAPLGTGLERKAD